MNYFNTGTGVKPLIALVLIIAVSGCDEKIQREIEAIISQARGEVSAIAAQADSRIVNNDLDYGISLSFTVTNRGKPGVIKVSPWLSSSEGEWSRSQNLKFTAGQSMNLTYFFPEPTINASNIQFGVDVSP